MGRLSPTYVYYKKQIFYVQTSPCGHVTAQKYYLLDTKKTCGLATAQKYYVLGAHKAPVGPCGHVTAQICNFLGTKKPLRACYCSEMLFFRYKQVLACMLLLRNAIF